MTKFIVCSFCRKAQNDVLAISDGGLVYICNECVENCVEILQKEGLTIETVNKQVEIEIKKLGLNPILYKLKFSKENHCFYLCPFKEPFNTIYSDHAVKAINSLGFTIERADEFFGTQPIIEDIWEGIVSASIIIADVTERNPNVMYEIGMAHMIGKPVIIITQNIDDIPFDLKTPKVNYLQLHATGMPTARG